MAQLAKIKGIREASFRPLKSGEKVRVYEKTLFIVLIVSIK